MRLIWPILRDRELPLPVAFLSDPVFLYPEKPRMPNYSAIIVGSTQQEMLTQQNLSRGLKAVTTTHHRRQLFDLVVISFSVEISVPLSHFSLI
jgi:hypothetical protein